jgi:hypothetical protein
MAELRQSTRSTLWAAAILGALVLSSCSLKLKVTLFNNSGEGVTVRVEPTDVVIGAGQSARFDYPGGEQNWTLHVVTARCDYSYAVPRTLDHYPWPTSSNRGLVAQLEQDFLIFLLPPSATQITPVTGLSSLQQDGFPVRPVSQSCR